MADAISCVSRVALHEARAVELHTLAIGIVEEKAFDFGQNAPKCFCDLVSPRREARERGGHEQFRIVRPCKRFDFAELDGQRLFRKSGAKRKERLEQQG